MLFLATVEAGIHRRHPEEPAGTHAEVTRGHMPRREPTPWRCNKEMIEKAKLKGAVGAKLGQALDYGRVLGATGRD